MESRDDLRNLILETLNELINEDVSKNSKSSKSDNVNQFHTDGNNFDDLEIPDISEVDLRRELLVPNPINEELYLELKAKTSARVGIWRAGPRQKTSSLMRFQADHAGSQDAVFGEVSEELVEKLDLLPLQTKAEDKEEYLTRIDLGRQFDETQIQKIKDSCDSNPKVQIVVADGLSATAIERNAEDVINSIKLGLEAEGISVGKGIFVKFGRVPSMDPISEATNADVTCLLVGERPGLVTSESMSAYISYRGTVGMPEANRSVISNIYNAGGTPTVEAGAHISSLIVEMLEKKASGTKLKDKK